MFVAAHQQYSVTPTSKDGASGANSNTPGARASAFFRDVKRRSLRVRRLKGGAVASLAHGNEENVTPKTGESFVWTPEIHHHHRTPMAATPTSCKRPPSSACGTPLAPPPPPASRARTAIATSPGNVSMISFKESASPLRHYGSLLSRISTTSCPATASPFNPRCKDETPSKFAFPSSEVLPPPSAFADDKENCENFPPFSLTPSSIRKSRRRSHMFTPTRSKSTTSSCDQTQVGPGRSIPVRQGYLNKRGAKGFGKEWKKKYVTLCEDGRRLTYHPSLHDYMENVNGKEIPLQYVTVKVPGQRPRGSRSIISLQPSTPEVDTAEVNQEVGDRLPQNGKKEVADTPTPTKKQQQLRSSSQGRPMSDRDDPVSAYEFQIVSLDNKQWFFEASSADERDAWVSAIESQILSSLQGNSSDKAKSGGGRSEMDNRTIKRIKGDVPGNLKCVDCDAPNPDWASLNLGVLMCIECSGIHRQLGSHISRVRSLDLDEWPPGHLAVMVALGNRMANSAWEAKVPNGRKPKHNSPTEEKERYIKAKYVGKEFLREEPRNFCPRSAMVKAICSSDTESVQSILAHSAASEVNGPVNSRDGRTPLHLAASLGNLAITQLLLWANADVNAVDFDGRTCLFYARSSGSQEVVNLLLANGCPRYSKIATPETIV